MRHKYTAYTRSLFWFTLFFAVIAVSLIITRPFLEEKNFLTDFRVFYCAGMLRSIGENPYSIEPLRSCEHHIALESALPNTVVTPAPLPGYDLAFFSIFAKMPFPEAALLWESLIFLAFCATVFMLTQVSSLEPELIFAALFLSDAMVSLALGQIAALSIAALTATMFFLSRQKFHTSALFAAGTLIEPHIGLGACLSLLFFAPQCRRPLIVLLCALTALSLSYNTLAQETYYFQTVLPAHAFSEIANERQYSLAHVVRLAGFSDGTAYDAGTLSYVMSLSVGLFVAQALARRTGAQAFLPAIPPAFSVIGGPFVHIQQIAAALPAVTLLLAQFPTYRFAYGLSFFLLAVPWDCFSYLLLLAIPLFATTMLLSERLFRLPVWAQVSISLLVFSIVLSADMLFAHPSSNDISIPVFQADALAEKVWRVYVQKRHTGNQLLFLSLHMLTWGGLLIMSLTAMFSLKGKNVH